MILIIYLQVYDIDNLKHIYFKNTTEILVSKVLKRTESPYPEPLTTDALRVLESRGS